MEFHLFTLNPRSQDSCNQTRQKKIFPAASKDEMKSITLQMLLGEILGKNGKRQSLSNKISESQENDTYIKVLLLMKSLR